MHVYIYIYVYICYVYIVFGGPTFGPHLTSLEKGTRLCLPLAKKKCCVGLRGLGFREANMLPSSGSIHAGILDFSS